MKTQQPKKKRVKRRAFGGCILPACVDDSKEEIKRLLEEIEGKNNKNINKKGVFERWG